MTAKDRVLKILEENRGEYISGAEIAKSLSVSRTAVWKSVNSLIADGVGVISRAGCGYALPKSSNALTKQGIEKYLAIDGLDIRIYKEVKSTNDVAKALAADGAGEGVVVIAQQQSGGKGRLGRKFYSPSDSGVYMTIILRPSVEKTPYLTVLAAVAVAEGIERAGGKPASIKWVNDVFADGKKCCGILTEAVADLETGGVEFAVVGMGVNVTTPDGGFAPEIKDVAAAACDGVEDGRNKVVAMVLNAYFEAYRSFDKAEIAKRYKAKSFLTGREITVVKGNENLRAKAIEIDDDCRLVVEYGDGLRETLSAGEVSLKV